MYSTYDPYSYSSDYYSSNPFEEFTDFLGSSEGAFLTGFLAVYLVMIAVALLVGLLFYIFEAFPIYKLAKKTGRKMAWLAWIPIFGVYFRTYVLADIAGDKELVIIPEKVVIKNRQTSFWIYLGISVLGPVVIGILTTILSLIPVIGWFISMFTTLLVFVPVICTAFMEYAYLRDVLDIFKEDKKANNTAAIVVTALDAAITGGLARLIYLYTILKCEPIYGEPTYENTYYEAPVVENVEATVQDINS